MAECKNCIHNPVCDLLRSNGERDAASFQLSGCDHFKDRSRFVELPCKVWDKVWVIDKMLDSVSGKLAKTVCEAEIFKISYNGFTSPMEWLDYRWDSPLVGQTTRHDRLDLCLGVHLFFAREEAEKALAERSDANG